MGPLVLVSLKKLVVDRGCPDLKFPISSAFFKLFRESWRG